MSSQFAAAITVVITIYLLACDARNSKDGSRALWIPMIWMFLLGSRYVSQWANLGSPIEAVSYDEGSPLDRAIFMLLITSGIVILSRRKLNVRELIGSNRWVFGFFVLGAVSILWSDAPIVSLKRWAKGIGTLTMALVVLTEDRPGDALAMVLRRMAYISLPLSVLFIRYYPELGRGYAMDGEQMFTGISSQKNGLGLICMLSGVYLVWELLFGGQREGLSRARIHFSQYLLIVPMAVWLLYMSHSATSIMCFLVATGILLYSRIPVVVREPRRNIYPLLALLVIAFLLATTDLSSAILGMLGRDATLTTRVPMWIMLLNYGSNPLIGAGYESFWYGERMARIWQDYPGILQAHNGYVDLYLNMGIAGIVVIIGIIISGISRAFRGLHQDYRFATLKLTMLVVFVLYNWTEAAIKPMNNLFSIALFSALSIPNQEM